MNISDIQYIFGKGGVCLKRIFIEQDWWFNLFIRVLIIYFINLKYFIVDFLFIVFYFYLLKEDLKKKKF